MQETRVQSLGREDPLEEGMATHSSILAWRILWTEEPGRLQSTGSQRVGNASETKPPPPPVKGRHVKMWPADFLYGNMKTLRHRAEPSRGVCRAVCAVSSRIKRKKRSRSSLTHRHRLWAENRDAAFWFWHLPVLETYSGPSDFHFFICKTREIRSED